MFVTGPDVIRAVTHEEVTMEDLGGAETHNTVSGNAHFLGENDEDCLRLIRQLLSFLPSNNLDPAPRLPSTGNPESDIPSLEELVPEEPDQPYDVKDLIGEVVDEGPLSGGSGAPRGQPCRRFRPTRRSFGRGSWRTSPQFWPECWTSTLR